jgi:hypothetical protein
MSFHVCDRLATSCCDTEQSGASTGIGEAGPVALASAHSGSSDTEVFDNQ